MERYIKVNMVPGIEVPQRAKVSQYEKGWPIYVDLYYENDPWTPPAGSNCYVQGTKKDKTGFIYSVERTGNRCIVMLTDQMTVFDGEQRVELIFTSGENVKIATANFILDIEPAALTDDTIISHTDIPVTQEISQIIAQIAAEILADSTEQALVSESYAKGTRNGTDVPSTDPAYQNNSKYYAQQAASVVSDASASAAAAAASATDAATSASDASDAADEAAETILTVHDWAIGPTGTPGEPSDTNNAKYYSEQAGLAADECATMWAKIQSLGIDFYLDPETSALYVGYNQPSGGES